MLALSPLGRVAFLPLALLLGGLAPAPVHAGEKARGERFDNTPYPAAFRARVDRAIDLGAHWLLRTQRDDGSWNCPRNDSYPLGPTALATLAALKSGVPGDHPRIERAFEFMRAQPLKKTYSVALLLMALDARYEPAPETFATEPLDRYGNRITETPCKAGMTRTDLAWMKKAVRFLVDTQRRGYWRYPEGEFDLSNTQYAMLGLKAAQRCGVKVPAKVWLDALVFLLDYQRKEGKEVMVRVNEVRGDERIEFPEKARARGFSYGPGGPLTGSMGTAGLACLLICQSELWKSRHFSKKLRKRTREGVRDGFAWLQANYSVHRNPGAGRKSYYYYMYGLERACILGHARFVGSHDWYAEGAEALLAEQAEDGSWGGVLVDTCFALLFLKRASFRVGNPAITPITPSAAPPQAGD
ncbi:MAG: prenyltransferase/squalene oxidase repeat-containing protein [Planctomycetota bacterium]